METKALICDISPAKERQPEALRDWQPMGVL
jgi:hypothetical protein